MSELDTKQKVLLAFYTEYQKDLPDMASIQYQNLYIEKEVFIVALKKLVNENLVTNVKFFYGDNRVFDYYLNDLMVTSIGLEYVENKLQLEPTMSGSEKATKILKQLGEWGLTQFKDVISKTAAELIKTSV